MGENIIKVADAVLKPHAEETVAKFTRVLSLFSKCHHGYNSSVYMNDEKVKQLGMNSLFHSNSVELIGVPRTCTDTDIVNFMADYRASFPQATVLPKMHILEDHVIPWFNQWHIGFGMMGEQGAESIHAHLMRIEDNYNSIANDVDRLTNVFKESCLQTAPALTTVRPPPKKRRKVDTPQQD